MILAGAFYWFTTHHQGTNPAADIISRPTHVEISQAAGPEKLDPEEQNNIEVYRRVIPSVVNITSRTVAYDLFFGPVPEEGQGSGFIIDNDGHILTNYHVVGDSAQVEVTLHNKKTYKATVIGRDRGHDLAVVQIKAPELTPAVLGESKNLQVGQKVFAIGNPFGLSGTMTRGIISSLRPIRSPERRVYRRGHSDRCRDQSRQLWRPAAELAWRSDRHQQHDRDRRLEPESNTWLCSVAF